MNEQPSSKTELLKALKYLARHYVGLMEHGRDRIIDLGGSCDPVEVMERGDPHLRIVREVIATAEREADEPSDEPVAYLKEWSAHDGRPPGKRTRVDRLPDVEHWMTDCRVTPLYRRAEPPDATLVADMRRMLEVMRYEVPNDEHRYAIDRLLERVAVTKSEPATWMPPCPVCKKPDCRLTMEECDRARLGTDNDPMTQLDRMTRDAGETNERRCDCDIPVPSLDEEYCATCAGKL